MNLLKKFVRDEAGMETVEWAILAALIVATLVVTITAIGTNVKAAFDNLLTATGGA